MESSNVLPEGFQDSEDISDLKNVLIEGGFCPVSP